MKSSVIKTISSGLVALMAITSGCSKSQVPAEDQATADGQAGGGGGAMGGAGGAGRLSSSAVSIQATKLPDGIRMRLVDTMTSEDAVKTVGNVPESAKFIGAFKLNGSGTLQGSVVQVAAGADLYDLKFPADPVKLPATVFLFASTQASPATLGLTEKIATRLDVQCDDSGICDTIENPGEKTSSQNRSGDSDAPPSPEELWQADCRSECAKTNEACQNAYRNDAASPCAARLDSCNSGCSDPAKDCGWWEKCFSRCDEARKECLESLVHSSPGPVSESGPIVTSGPLRAEDCERAYGQCRQHYKENCDQIRRDRLEHPSFNPDQPFEAQCN